MKSHVSRPTGQLSKAQQAAYRQKIWLYGAAFGATVSPAGKRSQGQNASRTGFDSAAVKAARRYVTRVLEALKFDDPEK